MLLPLHSLLLTAFPLAVQAREQIIKRSQTPFFEFGVTGGASGKDREAHVFLLQFDQLGFLAVEIGTDGAEHVGEAVKVGESIVFGSLRAALAIELLDILWRKGERATRAGAAIAFLPGA